MMFIKAKDICKIIICILCVSVAVVSGSSVSAFNPLRKVKNAVNKTKNVLTGSPPQWYKNYRNAKDAAENEEWERAVELFEKAIKQEPTAKKWKNKDGSAGDYYPYLHLGMAYLALGDIKVAQQYCEESKKKGIAPESAIEECLERGLQDTEPVQVTEEISPSPSPAEAADSQPHVTPTVVPEISQLSPERSLSLPGTASRGQNSLTPQVSLSETPRKVYAVIIGIATFEDKSIPPLSFTINDAQEMYNLLTDPNYGGVPEENITLLLDEEATTQNIKSAIGKWLKRQAGEEDTVIIYYAGHGAPEEGNTYWVTYNSKIDDLYSTALDNNSIADMLARVESKRLITFLDSCYSAATVNRQSRTRDVSVEIPWDQFSGEGRLVVSASNGKELSLELPEYEHGIFTYYLLEGLKGEADGMAGTQRDGVIEVEELWNYVRNHVSDAARKEGNSQTPVFQGAISAGIPLTYNKPFLEEQKQLEAVNQQQQKLQELFEQGLIEAASFDCAFQMLLKGTSDPYIDGLLNEELSPSTFNQLFTCKR
ncbi:MAG: hypothetical protein GY801_13380 [bacterium]|nr:hypothetical protein [bacterium]